MPSLMAATTNEDLLKLLHTLSADRQWQFKSVSSSNGFLDLLASAKPEQVVIDVFFEEDTGFDLRAQLALLPGMQMLPVVLVAPGCATEEQLSERLDGSHARFQATPVDQSAFGLVLQDLMGGDESSSLAREHYRYATFIHAAGEMCHALNQPLTSLLCNLELAMQLQADERAQQRLRTSYESAMRIMQLVQEFQQAKRAEEKTHSTPVYLLDYC